MADTVSLPPRSARPRDVDIPVLPGVGIERQARLWMAERLRERGYGAQAG